VQKTHHIAPIYVGSRNRRMELTIAGLVEVISMTLAEEACPWDMAAMSVVEAKPVLSAMLVRSVAESCSEAKVWRSLVESMPVEAMLGLWTVKTRVVAR